VEATLYVSPFPLCLIVTLWQVHALFNTHIAACSSTVAFVAAHKMIYKKHISAVAILNGAVSPTLQHARIFTALNSAQHRNPVLFFKFSPHPACLDRRPGRRYSSRRLHHSRRRRHPRPAAGRIILRFSVCAPRALERRRCAGRVVCARCHGRHRLPVHRLLLFRRFAFFARFLLCVLLG
jgi:hypothetical protein